MKTTFESILCITDKNGNIVAFYRNDMSNRVIKMYKAQELGLEDIKEIQDKIIQNNETNISNT